MATTGPEVRLNKTPFTQQWEVVRTAGNGPAIIHRWPLHPDDAALLERALTRADGSAQGLADNGPTAVEQSPRLTSDERADLAAGWPDFWKVHAAVERILAARLRHDDGEADR